MIEISKNLHMPMIMHICTHTHTQILKLTVDIMKMFYPDFALTNCKDSDKYYLNVSLCIDVKTRN